MSEIREMLAETAARLFGDLADSKTTVAAETGTWPEALWNALEQAGLSGAAAPDAGADLGDLAVILRAAGAHAAPVPLAETLAAGWALGQAGLQAPSGPLAVATGGTAQLRRSDAGWQLSGHFARVPWATTAKAIAVIATSEGEDFIVLLRPAEIGLTPGRNLAKEPRDRLVVDAALPAERAAASPVSAAQLQARLTLFRLVQITGAFNQVLELTVRYANERVQFGKPIGKFQAVQQQTAVLACQVVAASVAVSAAVAQAEHGDPGFEIAASAIRVCDAISEGASIAHQVHGAMGVTYEHQLHLYTRRLWAWRDEIGDEFAYARAIGEAVAKIGGQNLWAFLTAPALGGAA